MNYNMEGLTKAESRLYIQEKLSAVHCSRQIFDDNALEALANAANGVPRQLNKLCNACLIIASSRNIDHIDSDIVMQAISDSQLG